MNIEELFKVINNKSVKELKIRIITGLDLHLKLDHCDKKNTDCSILNEEGESVYRFKVSATNPTHFKERFEVICAKYLAFKLQSKYDDFKEFNKSLDPALADHVYIITSGNHFIVRYNLDIVFVGLYTKIEAVSARFSTLKASVDALINIKQ